MPTVAESLVATLAAAGVKRIYGIVGDSLNKITDAMRRQKTIDDDGAGPATGSCRVSPCQG